MLQVVADQGELRLLVERVGGHELLVSAGRSQELQLSQPQAGARLLGPGLIEVIGQQGSGVARRGVFGRLRPHVGPRGGSSTAEIGDVDRHLGGREERHGAIGKDHPVPGAENGAGVVGGHMQAWGSLVKKQVRPQRVDHLLARETPFRLQRQQLDEAGSGPSAPTLRRDLPVIHGHVKSAEKTDLDAHLHPQDAEQPK